jgi:hypothetical protein
VREVGEKDTMNLHEELMEAIVADNGAEVTRLIQTGLDLNARCDQGASALFGAILHGNISILHLMLEHGADPNFMADEPASYIYADKPLDLALGCRFILAWDKYDPMVNLLAQFGATDSSGSVDSIENKEVEQRAREWQTRNSS